MISPAVSGKDILVAAGVGVFGAQTGWGIFVSREPPSEPDTCVTLYDTPGQPPDPKWRRDFPALQVRVRGPRNDYQSGYNKAQDVQSALLGLPRTLVNGDTWVSVTGVGGIVPLFYDDKERPVLVQNFNLIIEPADPGDDHREDPSGDTSAVPLEMLWQDANTIDWETAA